MKISAWVVLFTCATGSALVRAEDAPKPDNDLSFNIGIASDYRYRGISQSRLDPALQGGIDYINNPTGLYLGTWMSTIKWIKDAGGDASVEWDVYGGKRGNFTDLLSYDVGVLAYIYPSNGLSPSANTNEIYGQLGIGPAYIKISDSFGNLFGVPDSSHSVYADIGANIDIGSGFTVNLHAGHQTVAHNSTLSYSDWKLGITKDFGFASLSVAAIGTDTSQYRGPAPDFSNLGKTALVATLVKTF